jgi:AcrR family transcriptional regulator
LRIHVASVHLNRLAASDTVRLAEHNASGPLPLRFIIQTPAHRNFDESPATLKLVKAAKQVFLRFGGTSFSIRNVATEAGVSIGAVQHYYPKRDELLAAMLEFVVNDYEHAYERVFRELPFNAEARLLGAIDYLVADLYDQQSRQFFLGLFSLSCNSKFAATLMDEVFIHHRRNLASFIGAARPAFSEEESFAAATQIVAMLEGLSIFTDVALKHAFDRVELTQLVRSAVAKLLSHGPAAAVPLKAINRRKRSRPRSRT